jgi:hypothetical protein
MSLEVLLLSILIAGGRPDLALRGVVRDRDTGEPIENVLVEVLEEPGQAWSDSLGAYELPLRSLGPHRVRFSRLGYDTLEAEVVASGEAVLSLAVNLTPRPIALSGVRVLALGADPPDGAPLPAAIPEVGSRSFVPDDWRLGGAFGGPDALAVLAASPDVVMREDAPTALHVRGGSAAENVFFLDGIPVFNAYHSGGVLGAVNPDAVADVRLHAGVAPARLGGGLSSAIEIQTIGFPRDGFGGGIAMTPRGARGTVAHSLPGGAGGLLVSGRRSYRSGLWDTDGSAGSSFGDLLAKATVHVAGGAVDLLSFQSRDRMAFDAFSEPTLVGAGVLAEGAGGPDGSPASTEDATGAPDVMLEETRNRFDWDSQALGLVWRRGWAPGLQSHLRAWRSGFDAAIDWAAEDELLHLSSARTDVGLEGTITGRLAAGQATGGLRIERSRVHYRVESSETGTHLAPGDSLLALESAPTILTAYAENAWPVGDRLVVRAGLRGRAGSGLGPGLEPRFSLVLTPTSRLVLSAGYARTVQDIQSLRNEESILDAVVGIDLPVAADGRRVPSARADQLTAGAEAWLGGTRLSLEGYARWLEDLVLVAPVTSQPFALQAFEIGSGRASGATLVIERPGPRLSARMVLALATTTRRAGDVAYSTAFERGSSAALVLDYRLAQRTRVGMGLQAASGSPTSLVAEPFAWEPNTFGENGDIEGSPQHTVGPLNSEHLPSYVRWDLGLRHEWSAPWSRLGSILAAYLDVGNVLNRQNAVGYVLESGTSGRRSVSMFPRSVTFGLEWRY